jgi:hypothetical protein
MRRCTAVLTVLLVLAAGASAREKSLDQLISEANSAPLKSQPKLYTRIAERQLRDADRLYRKGQLAEARAAAKDVGTYSGKASEAAISSGKDLKHTEIAIRKMADKLQDIQRNLAFNERAPLQDVIDKLESMRTQLLTRMFGKGKK